MSDVQVTLDQWVSDTINQTAPAKRESVSRFRKNWYNSARDNPALYPLSQADHEWRDHFEWFLGIEQFDQPGLASPIGAAPGQDTGVVEETVVYDSGIEAGQMETIVMDQPEALIKKALTAGKSAALNKKSRDMNNGTSLHSPPTSPSAGHPMEDINELDDLGTLIMEAGSKHDEVSIKGPSVDTPPRDPRTVDTRPKPASGNDQEDLDDLGTLIREAEIEQNQGKQGESGSTNTVASAPRPPRPRTGSSTTKASPQVHKTGTSKKPPQNGSKTAPAPAGSKSPPKYTTSTPPQTSTAPEDKPVKNDVEKHQEDLDLNDLDTMTWMKD